MLVALTTSILIGQKASVRVEGEGYLRFYRNNAIVYTTSATLSVKGGYVVNQDGLPLVPRIGVGDDADLTVEIDGSIMACGRYAGRIVLTMFPAELKLAKLGSYFTAPTNGQVANPGEGLAGVIRADGKPVAKIDTTPSISTVQKLTIRPMSEVTGNQFTLGDIATVSGEDKAREKVTKIDLGSTPPPGGENLLSLGYILSKMRNAGLNPDKWQIEFPEGAKVVRKSNRVESQAMIDSALDALKKEFEVSVPLKCAKIPAPVLVAEGKVELRSTIIKRDERSVDISVDVLIEGVSKANRLVSFTPDESTSSPVAKPQNASQPPAVRSGDTVTVRLVRSGGTIEVSGRATGTAPIGGTISVITDAVGSARSLTLTGRVKSVGVVEVQL